MPYLKYSWASSLNPSSPHVEMVGNTKYVFAAEASGVCDVPVDDANELLRRSREIEVDWDKYLSVPVNAPVETPEGDAPKRRGRPSKA